MVDFDADGHNDILSGSWPGQLYLFRGQADGTFAASEALKDRDGGEINVGSAAAAFAADWDADGDLDLLVGNIEGQVRLVRNEGSAGAPAFDPAPPVAADQDDARVRRASRRPQPRHGRALSAGGEEIRVEHGDAGPVVADWDGDGRLDLLVGTGAGGVIFCRNESAEGEPSLAAPVTLVEGNASFSQSDPNAPPACGMRAKICVADYNDDGRLDLLLGDFSMQSAPPPDLSEEEKKAAEVAQQKYQEALEQYQKEYTELLGDDFGEELTPERQAEIQEQLQPLIERFVAISQEYQKYQPQYQYHGYVWLLERKAAP